jgi:hypothetical protein
MKFWSQLLLISYTGFVFSYSLEQISLWSLLHASFLLWAVRDPIGFRLFKKVGRMGYAHIISVVLVVLIPLIGPCLLLRDGYIVTSFPSFACVGRNLDVIYFAIILPVSLFTGVTSSLLVVFFWTLFKVNLIGHIILLCSQMHCCSYVPWM